MFLVTRPEPKAQQCCNALLKEGFSALSCPALKIETAVANFPKVGTNDDTRVNKSQFFELIIVTSTYTSHFLKQRLPRMITAQTSVLCVGQTTAAIVENILKEYASDKQPSISVCVAHPQNSEGVIAHPLMQSVRDKNVALIKGRGGRNVIEAYLYAKQANLEVFEVYQRTPVYTQDIIKSVEHQPIQCIIVTSVDIAQQVLTHFDANWLKKRLFMVVSQRIYDYLKAQGIKHLALAHDASNQAIVACAKQLHLSGVLDDRH